MFLWPFDESGVELPVRGIQTPLAEFEVFGGLAEPDNRIEEVDASPVVVSRALDRFSPLIARQPLFTGFLRSPQISITEQRAFTPARCVSAALSFLNPPGS